MFYVYILKSEKNGRYYIGCTQDLNQRLYQHNVGMSRATRNLRPWELVYTEEYEDLSQARQRETQIKSWKSRKYMQQALGLMG